ncbi:unnamed protein product, partial [marine sediment metagenome]
VQYIKAELPAPGTDVRYDERPAPQDRTRAGGTGKGQVGST